MNILFSIFLSFISQIFIEALFLHELNAYERTVLFLLLLNLLTKIFEDTPYKIDHYRQVDLYCRNRKAAKELDENSQESV